MHSLIILGKRWFNKKKGSTYHSVTIYVDNKFLAKIPYAYGYGRHYEKTARDCLQSLNCLPNCLETESLWAYCDRNKIDFINEIVDVGRKGDL